jgi:hypothetical protein
MLIDMSGLDWGSIQLGKEFSAIYAISDLDEQSVIEKLRQ